MSTHQPIQLFTESLDITNEGNTFLKSLINKKLCIITITGQMYSGKSLLSNFFVNQFTNSFQIGDILNKMETCTKGMWVWDEAIPTSEPDTFLLIIDVEGFTNDKDDSDKIEYSKKLFALCALMSSVMIFNVKKPDEDDNDEITKDTLNEFIEQFELLCNGLNEVKLNNENEAINCKHLSDIIWINRDYEINDLKEIKEYFYSEIETNTNMNKFYKNKISFHTLSQPMDENDLMINSFADMEDEDEVKELLHSEFIEQFDKIKEMILKKIKPFKIEGIEFDGPLLYGLLLEYSTSLQMGEYPVLSSSFESPIFSNLIEIKEKVIESLRDEFSNKENTFTVDNLYQQTLGILTKNDNELLNKYSNGYIGKELKYNYLIVNIVDIIDVIKDLCQTKTKDEILEYKNQIKDLIEKAVIPSSNLSNNDKTFEKNFLEFINEIKTEVNDVLFSNTFFPFVKELKDYFENRICKTLSIYCDKISSSINSNASELEEELKLKQKDINEKNQFISRLENQILELKKEKDILKREHEVKIREYEYQIELEKDRYNKQEELFKKKFEEQETKIKELSNKHFNSNSNVNIDIPISMDNDIKKNNNFFVKSTMLKINKILEEYADYVEKLETYKDIVFKDKFVEKSITNIDSSNKTLISGIRNFKEEMDKKKIDKCEQDNLELMEEIDQLKKQLRDKENAFFELKNEFQKMKNQCDNISTLDKLVKEKQELVQLYVSRLDKIKKDKFDLETNLGNVRAQLKLKETEFQLVFDVFENMLEKKSSSHSSYQRNLQKLDGDSRGKIEQLCRTYKVFKK